MRPLRGAVSPGCISLRISVCWEHESNFAASLRAPPPMSGMHCLVRTQRTPRGDEVDQVLDALEVLAHRDVLVGLVRLRNGAGAEDDGRNAALIDQMAHVAGERAGMDVAAR